MTCRVLGSALLGLCAAGCSLIVDTNKLHGGSDGGQDLSFTNVDLQGTDLSGADLSQVDSLPPITNIQFAAGTTYKFGTANGQGYDVAAGDLNGDGIVDLAVANWGENQLGVLIGKGDGTFKSVTTPFDACLSPSDSPWAITLGRFNSDTKLDVIIACDPFSSTDGGFTVFLNMGNDSLMQPTFSATQVTSGVPQHTLAGGDFDKDGNLDLAIVDVLPPAGVTNINESYFTVYFGNANGVLGSPVHFSTKSTNYAYNIVAADLNNDGRTDLTMTMQEDDLTRIFINKGGTRSGLFTSAPLDLQSGISPYAIAVGDTNLDGNPPDDLVIGSNPLGGPYYFSSWVNRYHPAMGPFPDGGVFDPPAPQFTTDINPIAIGLGDFNRDGKPDVATGCYDYPLSNYQSYLDISLGDGTGMFGDSKQVATMPNEADAIAVADFNGDGLSDVAVVSSQHPDLFVLLNTSN